MECSQLALLQYRVYSSTLAIDSAGGNPEKLVHLDPGSRGEASREPGYPLGELHCYMPWQGLYNAIGKGVLPGPVIVWSGKQPDRTSFAGLPGLGKPPPRR